MKKIGVLIIAVSVLMFGISITAKAASSKGNESEISAKQYAVMEEQYMHEARMILLEKGCKNAGITLTYIIDVQGNREYTVAVHHTRLEKLSNQEMSLMTSRLQESGERILLAKVSMKQL